MQPYGFRDFLGFLGALAGGAVFVTALVVVPYAALAYEVAAGVFVVVTVLWVGAIALKALLDEFNFFD